MNLVHFQPWSIFNDRAFTPRLRANATDSAATWRPAADVVEYDDRFELALDVPGVDPDSISITVENQMLSISAERNAEREINTDGYRRFERFSGKMQRRFSLPSDVDGDAIAARSAHGVLTISVPKKATAQPRKITVAA